jgi:hypothetical protein
LNEINAHRIERPVIICIIVSKIQRFLGYDWFAVLIGVKVNFEEAAPGLHDKLGILKDTAGCMVVAEALTVLFLLAILPVCGFAPNCVSKGSNKCGSKYELHY